MHRLISSCKHSTSQTATGSIFCPNYIKELSCKFTFRWKMFGNHLPLPNPPQPNQGFGFLAKPWFCWLETKYHTLSSSWLETQYHIPQYFIIITNPEYQLPVAQTQYTSCRDQRQWLRWSPWFHRLWWFLSEAYENWKLADFFFFDKAYLCFSSVESEKHEKRATLMNILVLWK